ncbi:MAG: hypothetical protein WAK75_04850 [Methanoregula sp.]
MLVVVDATPEGCFMADEGKSGDISSMTVIGIGVVLFIIIIAIWYLFMK